MEVNQHRNTERDLDAFFIQINNIIKNEAPNAETLHVYDTFAKDYDQRLKNVGYTGPALAAEYFNKHARRLNLKRDFAILDVGAGTGAVGEALKHTYGYTVVDAIDPSATMLARAGEKHVYRNTYLGGVGAGEKIPVDDDTYDGAIAAGVLVPSHMPIDAMLEIIRVVKPGGIIVNVTREEFVRPGGQCDTRRQFTQWQLDGKWDIIEWVICENRLFPDKDAVVHVYKVCSNSAAN